MADNGDKPAKPAVESPRPPDPRVQTSIVITVGVIAANAMFFVLSMLYANERPQTDLGQVRYEFAKMTIVLGAAGVSCVFAPRRSAHVLALATAAGEIILGCLALSNSKPIVLAIALLVAGGIGAWLAYLSWFQRSRAAWSMLASLSSVLAVCLIFGAPKVRSQLDGVSFLGIHLDIGLWTALIYPGLKAVTVVALWMLRDDYRRRSPAGSLASPPPVR